MSSYYTHYAMYGIDISDKRDRIIEIEEETDQFDGLEGFSLNLVDRVGKIGYNDINDNCGDDKNFFGVFLDEAEEHGNEFSKTYTLAKLCDIGMKIVNKYIEFNKKYFPKEELSEPELKIKFFSTWY